MPRFPSFAVVLVAVAPALAGCAGEDAEVGAAAYPPIGYTPPSQMGPAAPPSALAPPTPPPPPGAVPGAPAAEWQWASPDEVAAGDPTAPEGATDGDGATDGNGPADDAGGGYADADPSALTDFRSALDPYGSWNEDPNYGTVWVPSSDVVGQDFTPYVSAGHWVYDHDYAWVSDYDWGWAPFHYGRWVYAQGPGWEWIPGRSYAGAWVSWRTGYDDWAYVGWAPLAPTWCWRGGVAVGMGYVPRAPYAFVGTGALFSPSIGARVASGPQVGVIGSHTRPFVPSSSSGMGPSVAGRVSAHPSVGGPSPGDLHIAPEAVARATTDNRGLTQARAFARPSTAFALGARPPQGASVAARSVPGAWSQQRGVAYSGRTYVAAAPSHFGGRFGGGFTGSAAGAAPMRAPSYGGARPYYGPAPRGAAPAASFRGYAGPSSTPSGFRAYSPAPGPRAFSAPVSHGGGASSYHGGGAVRAGGGGHGGRR
jgi:hypothetical protein